MFVLRIFAFGLGAKAAGNPGVELDGCLVGNVTSVMECHSVPLNVGCVFGCTEEYKEIDPTLDCEGSENWIDGQTVFDGYSYARSYFALNKLCLRLRNDDGESNIIQCE